MATPPARQTQPIAALSPSGAGSSGSGASARGSASAEPAGPKKLRVALADDSHLVQRRLKAWLEAEGDIEVAAMVDNGDEIVAKTRELRPDLVILDDRMHGAHGLVALHAIMRSCPTPTIVFCDRSATPERQQRLREKANELGALDVLVKPDSEGMTEEGGESSADLRRKVRLLSKIKVVRLLHHKADYLDGILTPPPGALMRAKRDAMLLEASRPDPIATVSASAVAAPAPPPPAPAAQEPKELRRERRIVVIGSSTGGPDAVRVVLSRMPATFPFPIVIAQHMPKSFTHDFAAQLARICPMPVSEATERDILDGAGGHVYIAPGDNNIAIRGLGFSIMPVDKNAPGRVNNRMWVPSIDEFFRSAAARYKEGVVGVVLTGLGNDGEKGVRSIKAVGGVVISQDEKTSNIFGMPKEAIATGCVDVVAPIDDIAQWIVHYTTSASRTDLSPS